MYLRPFETVKTVVGACKLFRKEAVLEPYNLTSFSTYWARYDSGGKMSTLDKEGKT